MLNSIYGSEFVAVEHPPPFDTVTRNDDSVLAYAYFMSQYRVTHAVPAPRAA
jgi:hypothetical protein